MSDQDNIWRYYQGAGVESFGMNKRRLEILARRVGRCTVLNIGAGDGEFERIALERGATVFTIDPTDEAIQRLRNNHPEHSHRFRVGRSEALPFEDHIFDAVVMTEVIEHLDPATSSASLTEVRRVLKPSGRFLGTVPEDEDLNSDRVACPKCGEVFHRWGHVQSFTKESLRAFLATEFSGVVVRTEMYPTLQNRSPPELAKFAIKYGLGHLGVGTFRKNRRLFFVATNA